MTLPTPLDRCTKIFMLHMNFASRAREYGDWPATPVYHLKPPSTLTSGDAPVHMPPGVETMLGEAEIAVIIGKQARNVTEAEALDYVSHYAAANDVTIFDYGWSDAPSLVRSKGFDTFTPMGALIPAGSVDPGDLSLRLWVNGVLRQEAHSSDLIFSFARLVAELSAIMTLEPGDVILTGTPAGAPAIRPGDEVIVDLAGRSRTVNTIVADPRSRSDLLPQPRISARGRGISIGVACHRQSLAVRGDLRKLIDLGIDRVVSTAATHGITTRPITLAADRATFAGHAFTLRQIPVRDARGPEAWPHAATAAFNALRAVSADEVIVAEGGFSVEQRDTLSARADAREAAAVSTADPSTPTVTSLPVAINLPIAVNGVTVMPGDVLLSVDGRALLIAGDAVDRLLEALP